MNTSSIDKTQCLLGLGALGVLLTLYLPTLFETFTICWNDDDYSHGLILPLISGYVLWTRRDEIRAKTKRAIKSSRFSSLSPLGLVLLTAGLLIYFLGVTSDLLYIRWVSFFFTMAGTTYLVFGGTPPAYLVPAVCLNIMAKPLPDSIVSQVFWPFQVLGAKVSARLLEILNVPVFLSGNIIEIPGLRLLVEEACSGMRSMMALLTVALIVLFLIDFSRIAQLLIVGLSVLLAITLNILRVALTGILAHFYDHDAAQGFFHTFSGMIVFFLGLIVLYYVAGHINRFSWAQSQQ